MNTRLKTIFSYIGIFLSITLLAFVGYAGKNFFYLKKYGEEIDQVFPSLISPLSKDESYIKEIWGENTSQNITNALLSLGEFKSCPNEDRERMDLFYDPVSVETRTTCHFINGKATFELSILRENGVWRIDVMNVYLPQELMERFEG